MAEGAHPLSEWLEEPRFCFHSAVFNFCLQGVSISTPGCDVVGIISHEIGHALGIFHEQARPDQVDISMIKIIASRTNTSR